jgi:hypothetical protein
MEAFLRNARLCGNIIFYRAMQTYGLQNYGLQNYGLQNYDITWLLRLSLQENQVVNKVYFTTALRHFTDILQNLLLE